jgi:hypothetical protein
MNGFLFLFFFFGQDLQDLQDIFSGFPEESLKTQSPSAKKTKLLLT